MSVFMIVASMFLLSQSITSSTDAIVIAASVIVGGIALRLNVAIIFAMLTTLFAITPTVTPVIRLLLLLSAVIAAMVITTKSQKQQKNATLLQEA